MDAELIQSDPAVMMGKPVVAGTRITVELILEKLSAGETIEEVVRAHPRLTREGVLAALGFAAGALRTGESGDTIPSDMGGRKFLLLKADIDRELAQVERLLQESRSDLGGVDGVPSRLEVRGLASVLQDFYSGVERVFERIAAELEGELPRGADWHNQLLNRMKVEVEGVRPPVLTSSLAERLRPFLRFRQLFRDIGGGKMRWERSTELLAEADEVWPLLEQQMQEFKGVLGQLHDGCR